VVTYVVSKSEKAEGPLGECKGRRLLEKSIPDPRFVGLLEREVREELFLKRRIPKQLVERLLRYRRAYVDGAALAHELAKRGVLGRHVVLLGGGELVRSARRPAGPLEIFPDRLPEQLELAYGLLPGLGRAIRVRRADDSLAETGIQVLGMEAEKDVARSPNRVGRIQKFLLNEWRSSIILEIRVAIAIYAPTTVYSHGSIVSKARFWMCVRIGAAI